jgi:hypothetical protein
MNNNHKKTKAEKRESKREKAKFSPTGGSFGAQAKRARVSRGYAGLPKALKPKVRIIEADKRG